MRGIVLIATLLIFPLACFAQDTNLKMQAKKANKIMKSIHNDILKIKEEYEELKNYEDKNYEDRYDGYKKINYVIKNPSF